MNPENDRFYDELSRLNNELVNLQRELAKKHAELKHEKERVENLNEGLVEALGRVKRLEGMIPICMHCHRIRDDQECWHDLLEYIGQHSDAQFSHGLCSDCLEKHYPANGADDDFSTLNNL